MDELEGPMVLVEVEVVRAAQLFFSLNFRYLCSKGRYEYHVGSILSFAIESKYWWCSAEINPSILHLHLVKYTMVLATKLLPISIGIESTFWSK